MVNLTRLGRRMRVLSSLGASAARMVYYVARTLGIM